MYNGEGVLVYPGENGCLPSIRLKVLREGMEDYEYFVILQSLGKESFADRQVKRIVKSWYQWDENPEHLLDIRRIVGEEINRTVVGMEEPLKEEQEQELVEKEEKVEQEEQEEQEEFTPEVEKEEFPEPEQNLIYWIGAFVILSVLAVVFWKRRKNS